MVDAKKAVRNKEMGLKKIEVIWSTDVDTQKQS